MSVYASLPSPHTISIFDSISIAESCSQLVQSMAIDGICTDEEQLEIERGEDHQQSTSQPLVQGGESKALPPPLRSNLVD